MPLEVQALTHAAAVSGLNLHWQESLVNGLGAIELSTGEEPPFIEFASRWWTVASLIQMGDLEGARPHALLLRALAERRSTSRVLARIIMHLITDLACLEGDWKAGREYSDRGLEVSLEPGLLGTRALLEHETGETTQGEIYLERLLEAMHQAGPDQLGACGWISKTIAAIARITGVPDRLEIAEAAAEAVLSEQLVRPALTINAAAGLALLAVEKGDQSAAKEHYAYLLGHRGTMIWTLSSVDRLLGLLSQTMGNLDQAVSHFEEALAFCRKAGYKPELAWNCCDYADMLMEQDGPSDQEKAAALLDESLSIATQLGMRPLMERVQSRRDKSKA